MSKPDEKGGFFERIAKGYFYGDSEEQYINNEYTNQLTPIQNKHLRRIKIRTLVYSALAGTLGVLLLYLPPFYFPKTFELWTVPVNLVWFSFSIPVFSLLYGIILAVVEIYFLVFLNIRAVHEMSDVCDFPPKEDPNYNFHIKSLVNIGVEKNAKNELSIGLNPYQGYSRFTVVMIFVWTKLRATLSNIVFKMILRRILGRYAVRVVVEIAGIPIMAAWNMWAANKVLKQARVRILSPGFIQQTVIYLHKKYHNNQQFKDILYDTMQFLAMRKRSFHENHYLLSINILKTFEIPFKDNHEVPDNFMETLKHLPQEMHNDIAHLMIIGMIVDGKISFLERKSIKELSAIGIIDYSYPEVVLIMQEFVNGKGKQMLDTKLNMAIA